MSMNTIEQAAISFIVRERELLPFLDNGITADFFAQERWNRAWAWITRYWGQHGQVPGETTFRRQFPDYDLDDTDEPAAALIDELIAKRRRFLVQEGVERAVEALTARDIDETLGALARTLTVVNTETSRADVTRSSASISGIVSEILTMKGMSLLGVPTGFPTIDEATGGLQREQLITIVAPPKHGKSTVSLAMAMAAQRYGKTGMYVTFEMSGREVYQRYVSLGAHVSLTSILRGRLTEQDKDALREFEEQVIELPDLVLVHDTTSTRTVGGIVAKMEQLGEIDYVVVDGAYLMDDELGEDRGSPRALTNITRTFKQVAQRKKLPIILTTQALISRTSKKSGVQLGSIGYTSSFAQDSDAIIGLDREDLSLPTATLKIIAARNALGATAELRFDYGSGYVEETGGYGYVVTEKAGGYEDDGE